MNMKAVVLSLVMAIAMPVAATAATFGFTVKTADGHGGFAPSFSFRLTDRPTPNAFNDTPGFGFFQIDNVTLTPAASATGVPASPKNLQFYTEITGGAFASSDIEINYFGLQLFDGSVSAPRFITGDYDLYVPSGDIGGKLNIAAVPEPANWAMLIGGLGLIGATCRSTRKRSILIVR